MSKFNDLQLAIVTLPNDMQSIKQVLTQMLNAGELNQLRCYAVGLSRMAWHLTSDESILGPLRTIEEILN